MATTQAQRAALYNHLAEAMNQEAADTLMDQLPPTGWDQMATKDDLANTEQRLLAALQVHKAETDAKFTETNAAMQAGFAELRALIATESAKTAKEFANAAQERADAAKERAEIIKSQAEIIRAQARQLYLIVAAIAVATVSVWVAVLTSVIVS